MHRSLLFLAALTVSCAQEIVVPDVDANLPDASVANENEDGSVAGMDAGQTLDGSAADADGGVGLDGGAPKRAWGLATLPSNTGPVDAIWADATTTFLGTSRLGVLRSEGTSFVSVWREPNNFGVVGIVGLTDTLFVASESYVYELSRPDLLEQSRVTIPRVRGIRAIATDGQGGVYIAATLTNGRGLYQLGNAGLATVAEPTDVSVLESLHYDSGRDQLFVGGNGAMFVYRSGLFIEDSVEWPPAWSTTDRALFTFESIKNIAGRLYAVGTDRIVFTRDPDDTWRIAHIDEGAPALFAIAGDGANVYVAGEPLMNRPLATFDGAAVTPVPFTNNVVLRTLRLLPSGEFLAGGFVRNGTDGVLVRGVR